MLTYKTRQQMSIYSIGRRALLEFIPMSYFATNPTILSGHVTNVVQPNLSTDAVRVGGKLSSGVRSVVFLYISGPRSIAFRNGTVVTSQEWILVIWALFSMQVMVATNAPMQSNRNVEPSKLRTQLAYLCEKFIGVNAFR